MFSEMRTTNRGRGGIGALPFDLAYFVVQASPTNVIGLLKSDIP